jgi:hypothetical protein
MEFGCFISNARRSEREDGEKGRKDGTRGGRALSKKAGQQTNKVSIWTGPFFFNHASRL